MKITKKELKSLIKEEVSRLKKIQLLENRKKNIQKELSLLNEEDYDFARDFKSARGRNPTSKEMQQGKIYTDDNNARYKASDYGLGNTKKENQLDTSRYVMTTFGKPYELISDKYVVKSLTDRDKDGDRIETTLKSDYFYDARNYDGSTLVVPAQNIVDSKEISKEEYQEAAKKYQEKVRKEEREKQEYKEKVERERKERRRKEKEEEERTQRQKEAEYNRLPLLPIDVRNFEIEDSHLNETNYFGTSEYVVSLISDDENEELEIYVSINFESNIVSDYDVEFEIQSININVYEYDTENVKYKLSDEMKKYIKDVSLKDFYSNNQSIEEKLYKDAEDNADFYNPYD